MQSMQQYCGCVSPFLEPALINATACSLLQLPCLTNWIREFYRWSYFDYVLLSAGFGKCLFCLPTCNGVFYTIYPNPSTLREATATTTYTHGLLEGLNSNRPLALIKLYFKNRYAQSTQKDLISDWVVMLNRFGGILSLFYGFSIISYIEVLYYLSGKWFVLIIKTWQSVRNGKAQGSACELERNVVAQKPIYALYWNELLPMSVRQQKYPRNITAAKIKINKK
ncbi:sodium channel protein Nach [Rhagoletis pomonella]|uniref:sodium channel protein Nach n=1 Tax=Rhagoletis pomonella TaxID=28610 RepID=UPI00177DCCF2|nr:sodium channel protein Nach [Rhagoletis pomonella]